MIRNCKFCGDEFEAFGVQMYCKKKHTRECVVCNETFEVKVLNKPAKVCSQKCVGIYSRNMMNYDDNVNKNNDKEYKYIKNCTICNKEFKTNNNRQQYCSMPHKKTCEFCGDEFLAKTGHQIYCDKQHTKNCEVCGKKFNVKQNHRPGKTCSSKCGGLISQINFKKKIKNNEIEYKYINKCEICNETFTTNRKNQIYCSMPHKMNCFHCGKEFEISRAYKGRTQYSCGEKECKQTLIENTNLNKYGVKNVFQSEKIQNKIKQTNIERHGVEYPGQSKEIMTKVHETMKNKYDGKTAMQSPILKKQILRTVMKKYGVDNVAKSELVQKNIRKTNLKRYGVEHSWQAQKVKDKINETNINRYGTTCPRWYNENSRIMAEQTNLDRYGAINPFGSEKIKERIQEINIRKYGVPWSAQAEEVKIKMRLSIIEKYGVENISQINIKNYNEYLDLENFLISTDMSIFDISEHFNLGIGTIRNKISEFELQEKFDEFYKYSLPESIFLNSLKTHSILDNIKYEKGNRRILKGKELDFYFPDNRFAVEISPTFTHNAKFGWAGKGEGLSKDYHIDKFLRSEHNNVELITIFDWHNLDNVTNLIRDKLTPDSRTLNPNETFEYEELTILTSEIANKINSWKLMNYNIFKNYDSISVLKCDNEILAISLWEEKINTSILRGMFVKPIQHNLSTEEIMSIIINNYINGKDNITSIIACSDNSLGSGDIYKNLTFNLIEESPSELHYYNNRLSKHIDYDSLTTKHINELMINIEDFNQIESDVIMSLENKINILEIHGFLPIYDCGHRTWKLNI